MAHEAGNVYYTCGHAVWNKDMPQDMDWQSEVECPACLSKKWEMSLDWNEVNSITDNIGSMFSIPFSTPLELKKGQILTVTLKNGRVFTINSDSITGGTDVEAERREKRSEADITAEHAAQDVVTRSVLGGE